MEKRGWEDYVFVSGDVYIDQPSFAAALVRRVPGPPVFTLV
jgi:hypothetical protein